MVVNHYCCQLAFFNARFHKIGIFENDLALKILKFIIYHLAFFYLQKFLFTVWRQEFWNLLDKIINLALFVQEFDILLPLKPGNTGSLVIYILVLICQKFVHFRTEWMRACLPSWEEASSPFIRSWDGWMSAKGGGGGEEDPWRRELERSDQIARMRWCEHGWEEMEGRLACSNFPHRPPPPHHHPPPPPPPRWEDAGSPAKWKVSIVVSTNSGTESVASGWIWPPLHWRLLLWASLVFIWPTGGFYPRRVASPNHLCDSILGPSE